MNLKNRVIESDKLSYMDKKSRNNRCKTMGKFTTNSTQYLPLYNLAKYEHIYDRVTSFITIKNIRQNRIVGMFDYFELSEYLEV